MYIQFFCLILSFISVRTVASINVEGPPLTIYRPCGLSLLHFENVDDNTWQGILDFATDQNSDDVNVTISFKESNTLRLTANSNNVAVHKTNNHTINIHVELPNHEPVTFDVILNNSVHKVPFIAALTTNDDTICNDKIKSSLNLSAPVDVIVGCFKHQLQGVCGKRLLDHKEVMSLRTEAKAEDWPWAVAVYHSNNFQGGGSIISHSVVITNGRIIFNKKPNEVTVVAGTSDLAEVNQIGRQTVQALDLIVHPGYQRGKIPVDNIGIIKVKSLKFSTYVQPVCIGDSLNVKSSSAVVVGFGAPLNQNISSTKLRSIDSTIQTYRDCKKSYSKYTELNLCAGYGATNNSPTSGDWGVGLVVPTTTGYDQETIWFLRGILISCYYTNDNCDPSHYSYYTNIAPYLGWIYYHTAL